MEEERKKKIASVLIREHAKLPLTKKESGFLQWGEESFTIRLGLNHQQDIWLSFGYSDMDAFDYTYIISGESYTGLLELFKTEQDLCLQELEHPGYPYLKKVITVLVFYHSEMKRAKDISLI